MPTLELLLQGPFAKQGLQTGWLPVACPGKVTVGGRVMVVGLTQQPLPRNFLCWGSQCSCDSHTVERPEAATSPSSRTFTPV